MLNRVIAYLTNQPDKAELLEPPQLPATPEWLKHAATNDLEAAVALDAALKSAELAQNAVSSLQDKASSHLAFSIALIPIALAATTLAVGPNDIASPGAIAALIGFLLAAGSFGLSATYAALASGMTLSGGISLDRLGDLASTLSGGNDGAAALKAAQAEALRYAAAASYASGFRVAQDLFQARRLTVIGVLLAIVSMGVLTGSIGLERVWAAILSILQT